MLNLRSDMAPLTRFKRPALLGQLLVRHENSQVSLAVKSALSPSGPTLTEPCMV
jgi:hypothetical protein